MPEADSLFHTMEDFFLNSMFGLVLLAVLIVLGLCLTTMPFIMLA